MKHIKIKSRQRLNKFDCMLHSLVNSGMYRSYDQVYKLNKKMQKEYECIVDKSFVKKGIYTGSIFLPYAIKHKKKRIPIATRKYLWLSQLPKKGVYILTIKLKGLEFHHAIVVKNGMVFDSEHPVALSIEEYGNERINTDYCYKIKG